MPPPTTGARTGRPPRTSRQEILDGARRLIERDGWERLTIRRLAAEIGTSPATVYYHVRDRKDLLAQLLGDYADEMLTPRPALPDDPRERIVVAATHMRNGLAAQPWVVEVLTSEQVMGEGAVWLVETILEGAAAAGAGPEEAVHLYRQIWYYTAGEILIRRGDRPTSDAPSHRERVMTGIDADTAPHVAAVADRWVQLGAEDTYVQGLRALVAGRLGG